MMRNFIITLITIIFSSIGLQGMIPHNFSWVEAGKMAGMACPKSQTNIEWLKAENIGLIVTLTKESLEQMGFRAPEGIEFLHLQVPDYGVPNKEQVDQFINRVNGVISQGKAVVVHCIAGIGRTGTFLACWFGKEYKLSGLDAVTQLRARRNQAITTQEQLNFVMDYLSQDQKPIECSTITASRL